jgi:hypothetical protein
MARPKKAVVDYFPHFVNHGKTMFMLESKYGNDGYAFWFKLLELFGAAPHHFIDANDAMTWEFMLAKTKLSGDTVTEILNLLSRIGAINVDLWKFKVIRSDNFIENMGDVYSRRDINLVSNSTLLSLCEQNEPLSGVYVDINPQSKVKESKVDNKEPICQQQAVDESTIPLKQNKKPCPHTDIINLYHEKLPELASISTKVVGGKEQYNWTGARASHLKSRWAESERRQTVQWWADFFGFVKESDFLMGKTNGTNGRSFKADLGWLIKPENFNKVVEGKYTK